jgi:hypothetical protein
VAFKISNIYKSLVRHLVDTIETTTDVSSDLQYFSWDAADDIAELPTTDLIGLAGWTFSENRGLWEIHCGITLSTINDENLLREIELVDKIHDMWGEENPVPLRDDDGNEIAQLIVKEFDLLPAGKSEKRNYRPIGLTLRRTSNG